MGTAKQSQGKEGNGPVSAFVTLSHKEYEKLAGEQPDERSRLERVDSLLGDAARELANGGVIVTRESLDRIQALTGKLQSAAELIPILERGMKKTAAGHIVLSVDVDPAFVDELRSWARAGGHADTEAGLQEYLNRQFLWIMKQGWLCGNPSSAISLEFTPQDYQMLCGLADKKPGELTGMDLVALARQILDEATPAPFMGVEVQA